MRKYICRDNLMGRIDVMGVSLNCKLRKEEKRALIIEKNFKKISNLRIIILSKLKPISPNGRGKKCSQQTPRITFQRMSS